MADESGTSALSWVQEPAISDGKVAYKYKNTGTIDATFVAEQVSAFSSASGQTAAQGFQVDGLAAGAEQETHAPLPADLPDGPITINVFVQSSSGGESWDGELVFELAAQIAGGTVHPAGEAEATGTSLAVDIVDVKLDDEELVIHYRITGDAHLDAVSIFLSILDPNGGDGWMNSFIAEVDREDIFRTAIPFGEVMDTDEGWAINAGVTAGDTKADVNGHTRINFPVHRVDGKVVAAGDWSTATDT